MTQPVSPKSRMICVHLLQVMQHFFGVKSAGLEQVGGRVGIGDAGPAKPHQAAGTVLKVCGSGIGDELPQPAISGADNRDISGSLLDRLCNGEQPGNAFQRMFFWDRAAFGRQVKGPRDLRVAVIGIAGGAAQQGRACLDQSFGQADGFFRIPAGRTVCRAAEAVWIGVGVEGVEPAGDDHSAAYLGPDGVDDGKQKAAAVFKGAAVFSFPAAGGQQFAQQIPVAGLDVHAVIAAGFRQPCAVYIMFDQPVQIVVADGGSVRRKAEGRIQPRVVLGDDRLSLKPIGTGVAAGMGKLQNVEGMEAMGGSGGFADRVHQPGKAGLVLFGQHHLRGIGPAFGDDGAGFPPKQAGASGGKT